MEFLYFQNIKSNIINCVEASENSPPGAHKNSPGAHKILKSRLMVSFGKKICLKKTSLNIFYEFEISI